MKQKVIWLAIGCLIAASLALSMSSFALSPSPALLAASSDGNQVKVDFLTNWVHVVYDGDSFANGEVSGQRSWRIANIANIVDDTGAPVTDLVVTLNSDLAFNFIREENLTRMGPPTYEWSFGNLVEEPEYRGWAIDAYVGFTEGTLSKFTPGFDASRSCDKTEFSAPDTQTVTVRVTPREEWMDKVDIFINAKENDLVDPVIISLTGGENIRLPSDGRHAGIHETPVEPNTPLTVVATIRVTPKVPEVEYKPNVQISPHRTGVYSFGNTVGSSFSYTNEAGTWIVSADGNYAWSWVADSSPGCSVAFFPIAEPPRSEQGGGVKSPVSLDQVPASVPTAGSSISWQVVIGIAAGIAIIALVVYFFIRTRRRA